VSRALALFAVGRSQFRHSFPASPAELAPLRARLRGWLERAGLGEDLVSSTILGISEAAANSVEHGLRFDTEGTVTVVARLAEDDGRLDVTVSDDGGWREAHGEPNRGHGFRIMDAVMDDVSVERLPGGTIVRMRRMLKEWAPA
jgi:anti-sigma regulatory factor (Ser/Thr protein kinase)